MAQEQTMTPALPGWHVAYLLCGQVQHVEEVAAWVWLGSHSEPMVRARLAVGDERFMPSLVHAWRLAGAGVAVLLAPGEQVDVGTNYSANELDAFGPLVRL